MCIKIVDIFKLGIALSSGLLSLYAHAFTLTGQSWGAGETEVFVSFGPENTFSETPNVVPLGPSVDELEQTYIAAMNMWTNNTEFRYIPNNSASAGDPCTSAFNTAIFSRQLECSQGSPDFGANTLAVQFTFGITNSTRTVTVFNNAQQWDIYSGNFNGVIEFSRVAIHELGHGLGLDHSTDAGAIMLPVIGNVETLGTNDLEGVNFLYDADNDDLGVFEDNCPDATNPSQADMDNDGLGDECDIDADNDGVFVAGTDQSYGNRALSSAFSFGPNTANADFFGMTFPASTTGVINSIRLPLSCEAGNVNISIRTVNTFTGAPTSTILSLSTFSTANGLSTTPQGFVDFDFTVPASVVAGTNYALSVQPTSQCVWELSADTFAAGNGFLSNNGINWFSIGQDIPFETVISPQVVDNCPVDVNVDQLDFDTDGAGDVCDTDDDNDGLSDIEEANFNSNPLNADSDNDGLSDGDEVNIHGTSPVDNDSDDDGTNDGDEISNGTNPLVNEATTPVPSLPLLGLLVLAFVLFLNTTNLIKRPESS